MSCYFFAGVHKAATTWFALAGHHLYDGNVFHWEVDLKRKVYEPYNTPTTCVAPENSLVTNVCCDYKSFSTKIFKFGDWRGIYIYRDPRELIVSTYWSWLLSHGGGHPQRKRLSKLPEIEGGFML